MAFIDHSGIVAYSACWIEWCKYIRE